MPAAIPLTCPHGAGDSACTRLRTPELAQTPAWPAPHIKAPCAHFSLHTMSELAFSWKMLSIQLYLPPTTWRVPWAPLQFYAFESTRSLGNAIDYVCGLQEGLWDNISLGSEAKLLLASLFALRLSTSPRWSKPDCLEAAIFWRCCADLSLRFGLALILRCTIEAAKV